MTRPAAPFPHSFSSAQAAAASIGRGALYGPRYRHPYAGVHEAVGGTDLSRASARDRMLDEARRYFPRLRPGQFFSHTDALAMVGAPTPPGWRPGLHIAVHRPRYPPQTVGVVGHRLQTRDAATLTVAGLPVEHPARAWVQAASLWPTDDLIAAADFLVARRSPLVSLDELRSEAILIRRPGLVTALEEVRDGSESPQETKLRLAVVRAGLPEPQLNWELRDATGRFVARLDQAYPEYRVGVEYDGRQHAADVVQFARDADRWEAIRDEGWLLVRVLNHHLARGGETAVGKVRAALLSAGWRPDVGKFPFQR